AVEAAINFELKRQEGLLKKKKKIIQETRGWDDIKKETIAQRSKEEAHDYRYFPEPDLPPFALTAEASAKAVFDIEKLKQELPEMPDQKRKRLAEEFKLKPEQAEVLIQNRTGANFFEEAVSELLELPARHATQGDAGGGIQLLFNYYTSDLWGLVAKEGITINQIKITPENFADLINLLLKKEISSRTAKDILLKMFQTGGDPHEILKSENLGQVSDEDSLKKAAEKIIAGNPDAVLDYKKGKSNALQFLIGKTMSELGGRANPQILREIFERLLK
ncbi:MAG: Asp-tRNA(Asn)/Glu-tRNA(Gln) amidotransferase subunit GatB, partial [Patescibacteria group bacterium]